MPIQTFVSACGKHGLTEARAHPPRPGSLPVGPPTNPHTTPGLPQVRTDDWTDAIQPFWPAVIRSALRPLSLLGLLRAGWVTISAALTGALMLLGFKRGLIKFVVLAARKPARS